MRRSRSDEAPCAGRVEAYLLFGSNLGDRRRSIERGLSALEQHGVEWTARSSFYETEPVSVEDQPWFLNLAARGNVSLSPRALLAVCKTTEEAAGRRDGIRFGPRPLDIDILLYGRLEIEEPDLVIPHARLCERRFALVPLLEIAPDLVDFRDGRPFAAILRGLDDGKKVAKSTTREF
jgi:2-amino-4-hydroxy-6-hydroxymethyldihydropteridine diphosphokinase